MFLTILLTILLFYCNDGEHCRRKEYLLILKTSCHKHLVVSQQDLLPNMHLTGRICCLATISSRSSQHQEMTKLKSEQAIRHMTQSFGNYLHVFQSGLEKIKIMETTSAEKTGDVTLQLHLVKHFFSTGIPVYEGKWRIILVQELLYQAGRRQTARHSTLYPWSNINQKPSKKAPNSDFSLDIMLLKPQEEITGSIYSPSFTETEEKTRSNDSKSPGARQGPAMKEKKSRARACLSPYF